VSAHAAFAAVCLVAITGCDSCYHQRPAAHIDELAYPGCGAEPLPEGEVLASGHLRAGPFSRDQDVVERFEVRRRGCLLFVTVRQEWPLGTADVEVIYDAAGAPLRAWKRTTLPSAPDPIANADTRSYELRTEPATMKVRTAEGEMLLRTLEGPRPTAVVGPGRGLLTAWIQRAGLAVGEQSREQVLDFRSLGLERIEPVVLRREQDRRDSTLGRTVRVYTIFGRESVFTDEHDVVVGDLAGLREDAALDTPAPPPIPELAPPDPVNTP